MRKSSGRPKLKKEILSEGLTITVTKTEKKRINRVVNVMEISINQLFRNLLHEKIDKLEKELDLHKGGK